MFPPQEEKPFVPLAKGEAAPLGAGLDVAVNLSSANAPTSGNLFSEDFQRRDPAVRRRVQMDKPTGSLCQSSPAA
jgi:hypothetical protein